jgi:hypothetical protein
VQNWESDDASVLIMLKRTIFTHLPIKRIATIYCIFLYILLFFFWYINHTTKDAIVIQFSLDATGCDLVETFYDSSDKLTLDNNHFQSFQVSSAQNNVYQFGTQGRLQYFRIDPCNTQTQTKLYSILIKDKKSERLILPIELSQWKCVNCTIAYDPKGDAVNIKALNTDPIFYTDTFGVYYQTLKTSPIELSRFILFIWLSFLCFPMIGMIYMWKVPKKYIFLFTFTLGLFYFCVTHYNDIKKYFPNAGVTETTTIGYIHYFGYSAASETIMYFTLIFVPTLVTLVSVLLRNTRKRRHEK